MEPSPPTANACGDGKRREVTQSHCVMQASYCVTCKRHLKRTNNEVFNNGRVCGASPETYFSHIGSLGCSTPLLLLHL